MRINELLKIAVETLPTTKELKEFLPVPIVTFIVLFFLFKLINKMDEKGRKDEKKDNNQQHM